MGKDERGTISTVVWIILFDCLLEEEDGKNWEALDKEYEYVAKDLQDALIDNICGWTNVDRLNLNVKREIRSGSVSLTSECYLYLCKV